jgi:hypothetical protein
MMVWTSGFYKKYFIFYGLHGLAPEVSYFLRLYLDLPAVLDDGGQQVRIVQEGTFFVPAL